VGTEKKGVKEDTGVLKTRKYTFYGEERKKNGGGKEKGTRTKGRKREERGKGKSFFLGRGE